MIYDKHTLVPNSDVTRSQGLNDPEFERKYQTWFVTKIFSCSGKHMACEDKPECSKLQACLLSFANAAPISFEDPAESG